MPQALEVEQQKRSYHCTNFKLSIALMRQGHNIVKKLKQIYAHALKHYTNRGDLINLTLHVGFL